MRQLLKNLWKNLKKLLKNLWKILKPKKNQPKKKPLKRRY